MEVLRWRGVLLYGRRVSVSSRGLRVLFSTRQLVIALTFARFAIFAIFRAMYCSVALWIWRSIADNWIIIIRTFIFDTNVTYSDDKIFGYNDVSWRFWRSSKFRTTLCFSRKYGVTNLSRPVRVRVFVDSDDTFSTFGSLNLLSVCIRIANIGLGLDYSYFLRAAPWALRRPRDHTESGKREKWHFELWH